MLINIIVYGEFFHFSLSIIVGDLLFFCWSSCER